TNWVLGVALGACRTQKANSGGFGVFFGLEVSDFFIFFGFFSFLHVQVSCCLRMNPSRFSPEREECQGGGLSLLADLTQDGIVPFRAGRRQATFRLPNYDREQQSG